MTLVYLGTHEPAWLPRYTVPMFISRRRFARRKKLPRAIGKWALDSGGFTEISTWGAWQTSPAQYVGEVRRYRDEVGGMNWAAIQDWMCEPFIIQKTGLTVAEHQRRTVDSYAQLLDLAPEVPWCPVLQGFEPSDYFRCAELYAARGFDLRQLPIVGLGSVCRRQHTAETETLVRALVADGYRLHGFGFKVQGLKRVWGALTSSDSMAWSLNARKRAPLEGCSHRTCANCSRWAFRWLDRLHMVVV